MSAVQDAMRQRQQGARGRLAWPRRCPLLDEPFSLVGYVLSVLACYLTLSRGGGRPDLGDGR